jgi:hypothetical protein
VEQVILTRATWEVRWVVEKRVVVVDFGDDLAEALRIYTKALVSGRKAVTLRSKNVGFAPPQRLRPYTRKPKRKTEEGVRVTPLNEYNLRGWWWCPYCMQLRKFVLRSGFHIGGIWVPEPGYHCPMCGISHRDNSVAKWNPHARRYQEEGVRAPRRRKSHA